MTVLSAQEILLGANDLPVLPAVVLELLQSMADEGSNVEQLALKISHDQALAAKTLRLANSSFYGLSRQVTSIMEATTILGLRTLRSIATAAGLVGGFSRTGCRGFDFDAFWRHSIGTALCARGIAKSVQLDEDAAFTLGLLHDIGRLVMVSGYPERYALALDYRRQHDCLLIDAELSAFGTDHTAVGSLVAERWRFAPVMVSAIADHHAPPVASVLGLVDVVHVADNMAHALELSQPGEEAVPPLSVASWARTGLSDETCFRIFKSVEEQHGLVCQTLLS
ncbi:HDOD domain-containing protein [Rhodoferax sp. WC2427]|uniref:HDOD domain-containing protein n=1 Tax=Rhodoferax sp. WC2427 TaxID=3234144 RepID=UPI00346598B7